MSKIRPCGNTVLMVQQKGEASNQTNDSFLGLRMANGRGPPTCLQACGEDICKESCLGKRVQCVTHCSFHGEMLGFYCSYLTFNFCFLLVALQRTHRSQMNSKVLCEGTERCLSACVARPSPNFMNLSSSHHQICQEFLLPQE